MGFDLETYKRISTRLDIDGIDLGAFRRQPLAEDDLRCLRYMHDIESHTTCYLRDLLNTKAHLDPEVTTFMTMWGYEELWHGEAIGAVLAAHGEEDGPTRTLRVRRRLRHRLARSPLMWMAISSSTRHFLAIHMTVGAINEWTTQAAYARLAARSGHPVLGDLLRRIMRQEGRHIDFYATKATEHLAVSPAAQRMTRRVLRHVWQPVGTGVVPIGETRHLASHLFTGVEGRTMVERIDRRIDRLPGLDGLALVSGAVDCLTSGPEGRSLRLVSARADVQLRR